MLPHPEHHISKEMSSKSQNSPVVYPIQVLKKSFTLALGVEKVPKISEKQLNLLKEVLCTFGLAGTTIKHFPFLKLGQVITLSIFTWSKNSKVNHAI